MTIPPGSRLVASLLAVLLPCGASAAVFTAGPGGTHATVQEAINAAMNTAGDDEVRIAAGTWNERLSMFVTDGQRLDIGGGWNAAFDAQTADPALTIIDGQLLGRTFSLVVNDGTVTVRNVTIAGGRVARDGGNLQLIARGDSLIEFGDCVIRDGEVLAPVDDGGFGAGAEVFAFNDSQVLVERCEVRDNHLRTITFPGQGGGLYVSASQSGTLRLSGLDVHDNTVEGPGGSDAGMHLEPLVLGQAEVVDSTFADNHIVSPPGSSNGASGIGVGAGYDTQVEFRRVRVLRNGVVGGLPSAQMTVFGGANGRFTMADSLVADSASGRGLEASAYEQSLLWLVNLTLAGNAGTDLAAGAGVTISNTLADSTGGDIALATVVRSRFAEDPGYVDRIAGDYRLVADSPAINAGTLAPVGGLGTLDLDGNARVRGSRVDQGAFEADNATLFVDGFEEPL